MIALAFIIAVNSALAAALARESCALERIEAARSEFEILYEKGEFDKARGIFSALERRCDLAPGHDRPRELNESFFRVESEKALAYLKGGDPLECLRTLAPLRRPSPPLGYAEFGFDDDAAVVKAIEHNAVLCQKAADRESSAFTRKPCPLKDLPKILSGVALPMGGGASAACLLLIGSKRGKDYYLDDSAAEPTPSDACPRVVSATAASGKILLRVLSVREDDGPLADVGACCGLERLGYARTSAGEVVELAASDEQPPCGGRGTARFLPSAVYRLAGDRLELLKDTTISSH